MVFEDRLTRLTNMNFSVGDDDRLFVESWNFRKVSDHFFEDTTYRWMYFMLFHFLLLPFLFYSQPPFCIVILQQH